MTDTTALDVSQTRLLAALTLGIMQRLGGDALLLDEGNTPRNKRRMAASKTLLVKMPARFASSSLANSAGA